MNKLVNERTRKYLVIIFQIQKEIQSMPGLTKMIRNRDVQAFFENSEMTVVNRSVFLEQLDLVDNAACSWLSLIKGININVFHGFATEDDLVRYFLYDAYRNKVQVLASKSLRFQKIENVLCAMALQFCEIFQL